MRQTFQARALHANNNAITSIAQLPHILSRLLADAQALVLLNLSHNRIAHIPEAIGTLTSLEVLHLHNNALTLIAELAHLRPLVSLARLTLMNNPLTLHRMSSVEIHMLKTSSPLFCDESHQFKYKPRSYRLQVLARLPQLRQFDRMPVTITEKEEAVMANVH